MNTFDWHNQPFQKGQKTGLMEKSLCTCQKEEEADHPRGVKLALFLGKRGVQSRV